MLNEGGMNVSMQDTLQALADPTRREILNLLKQSRMSAGEISNHFSISGAAVSRHLSVLKEADLIRGLGLGGWMVQEGYMLKTGNFAGPQYKIKEKIIEVIGNEATEKFYQTYKDNGITKKILIPWLLGDSIRYDCQCIIICIHPLLKTKKMGKSPGLKKVSNAPMLC